MAEKRDCIFPYLYLRIGLYRAGGNDCDCKQLSCELDSEICNGIANQPDNG